MLRRINPPGPDESIVVSLATDTSPGLMSAVDKSKVDVNVATVNTISLLNFPTGGLIGNSVDTVDICNFITIKQTTPAQTLVLPNPSTMTNLRYIVLTNSGTVSFACINTTFLPGSIAICLWNGTEWKLISTNISNPASSLFNVVSSTGDTTITSWNSLLVLTSNSLTTVTLPAYNVNTQGNVIVIINVNNIGTVTLNSIANILPYNTNSIGNLLQHQYESVTLTSTSMGPVLSSGFFIDPDFVGADNSNNGARGWVPSPLSSQRNLFLRGDATWQPVLLNTQYINSAVSLLANTEYHVDTSAGGFNVTLPNTNIASGSIIRLLDAANNWSTNKLTIIPSLG